MEGWRDGGMEGWRDGGTVPIDGSEAMIDVWEQTGGAVLHIDLNWEVAPQR